MAIFLLLFYGHAFQKSVQSLLEVYRSINTQFMEQ